jgi:16S rRNA (guanine1207-N2)-methyltransferase
VNQEERSQRSEDPYLQSRLHLRRGSRSVHYLAPHSLFSSHRLDHGTLLLLDHLPQGEPGSFLDLGSGYGVLGLEVAARHPKARGLLVDRDLLAVEYSKRNADLQGARSVEARPSLGYRDLPPDRGPFDWILSNFPARAGEPVLEHFLAGGRARLTPGGEMRIVVIAPLAPAVVRAAGSLGFPVEMPARSRSHAVFRFPAFAGGEPSPGRESGEEVYERDCIRLRLPEELRLVRPSDLADEPHRLSRAIPLLAARLAAPEGARVLVFRSGYGLLPALVLSRIPGSRILAQDRDLLATAFTRRNCAAWGSRLEVEERTFLPAPSAPGGFDLVLGELSPPLGPRATLLEIQRAREALAPEGRGLILGLLKQWKEFLKPAARRLGLSLIAADGPAALLGLEPGRRLQSPEVVRG